MSPHAPCSRRRKITQQKIIYELVRTVSPMPFLNTNIKASLAAIPVHYSLLCALPRSPAAPEATRLSALLRVVLTHCSQIGESGDHQEAPQDYSNHLRLVSTFPFVQDNAAWKLLQMKFNREARTIFAAA